MSEENMVVGIVGTGAFGTALAGVIAGQGGKVVLWGDDEGRVRELATTRKNERRLPGVTLPASVKATSDAAELAGEARLVILAVPSTRVGRTVRALGKVLDGRHLLVHAVGALVGGQERVSELVKRETPVKRVGAVAGPALARDLADKKPCALVVASPFDEVINVTRHALTALPSLRVYTSRDLTGVELASALSGAMTVAVGLGDGLGFGVGPRAVLMTRAVAEAARVGVAAGARERTFGGMAGLGNLLVRAFSVSNERSDDYRLGLALATKDAARPETEGSRTAGAAVKLARHLGVKTPILDAVDGVVNEGLSAKEAAARLLETVAEEE